MKITSEDYEKYGKEAKDKIEKLKEKYPLHTYKDLMLIAWRYKIHTIPNIESVKQDNKEPIGEIYYMDYRYDPNVKSEPIVRETQEEIHARLLKNLQQGGIESLYPMTILKRKYGGYLLLDVPSDSGYIEDLESITSLKSTYKYLDCNYLAIYGMGMTIQEAFEDYLENYKTERIDDSRIDKMKYYKSVIKKEADDGLEEYPITIVSRRFGGHATIYEAATHEAVSDLEGYEEASYHTEDYMNEHYPDVRYILHLIFKTYRM